MKFTVEQNAYRVDIRWEYKRHHSWIVSKSYTYDNPPVIERAETVFYSSPPMPAACESACEQARRWTLAAELCRQLDNVYTVQDDFKDTVLAIETFEIGAAHFTSNGRIHSTRRVTIHVPA